MAIKHVALVRFKQATPDGAKADFFIGVGNLCEAVPGILDYSWGENNSPEGLSQGHTHGFVMTFQDARTRDGYLAHPPHSKVVEKVLPHVNSAVLALLH